jgi:hypothetical protein
MLLPGAVVGVTVCDMAKNPSFVHSQPVFKFDWLWSSRQMLIQRWVKPEVAIEVGVLVSEIIKSSNSILSAIATGEILRLKCIIMQCLVPVDPGFIAVFPYECAYLT